MSIVERLIELHDKHTLSGVLTQTPNIIIMSKDLLQEYKEALDGSDTFRGAPILNISDTGILVVGFRE